MRKIRLALLSGGASSEREVSLKSGDQVYDALDKSRYDIKRYDPKTDLKALVNDAADTDAALVILHGPYGEDGTVQGLLDLLGIPYQGAGVLGSAVAMNKLAAKKLYTGAGIPVPDYITLSGGQKTDTDKLLEKLGLPVVIKPVSAGSSVGMTIVRQPADLDAALAEAFSHDTTVLAEEYITGREITCGVLGNRNIEALPVVEIIPGEGHEFFDYEAKYVPGATEEICPARIDDLTRERAQKLAVESHKALFLKGYSRTDMILQSDGLFVLETNTIPGMTATSLYPQAGNAAGYTFSALLDTLIELAIEDEDSK